MKKKFFAKNGFSLAETLVTVLILALVTLGVTVGVDSSLQVYRESVSFSEAQILSSTLSEAVMDELRYAEDISAVGTPPTYTSVYYGPGAKLAADSDGQIKVNGHSIVGTGAYHDLTADIDYEYDGGCFSVEISVMKGTKTLSSTEFQVEPLTK